MDNTTLSPRACGCDTIVDITYQCCCHGPIRKQHLEPRDPSIVGSGSGWLELALDALTFPRSHMCAYMMRTHARPHALSLSVLSYV